MPHHIQIKCAEIQLSVKLSNDTLGPSYLECFDSYCEVVLFPHSHVHLPILASSQLVLHGDICALHLPLVMDGWHTVHCGLVTFGCWVVQGGDKAVGYSGVVVDQLGQCGKTALRCHIHLEGEGKEQAWRWVRMKEKRRGAELLNGGNVLTQNYSKHLHKTALLFHSTKLYRTFPSEAVLIR